MSQSGFTPIQLYRSSTAAAAPLAADLVAGELAINTTDEKLYFENASGVVKLLASSAAAGGTFTTVVNGLGAVGTPSYTFTGDLNTGMWSPAADTIAFSEGGVEAMRISSSGFVGIGTSSPSYALDVSATGNISGQFKTSGSINALYLADAGTTAGTLYVGTVGNDFRVVTGSNENVRVTSAGLVGIGTSAPGAKLEVSSTSAGATVEVLRLNNPGGGANTAAQIKFLAAGTNYGTITGGYGAAAPQTTFDLPVAGNYVWRQASVDKMVLDSSGKVGIGTTGPTTLLDIRGAAVGANFSAISIDNTSAGSGSPANTVSLNFSNAGAVKASITGAVYGDGYMAFATNTNAEKMRLDASGNLGIGTSAPGSILDVRTAAGSGPFLVLVNTSATANTNVIETSYTFNNASTGSATAAVIGATNPFAVGNTYGDIYFKTTNPTNGLTEKMRIDSAGNVGIGTASPTRRLSISGGDVELNANVLYLNSGNAYIQGSSTNILFSTNANERMRIDSSGNVGIGTTAPGAKLQVEGASPARGIVETIRGTGGTGAQVHFSQDGVADWALGQPAGVNALAFFSGRNPVTDGTERMRIDSAGALRVNETTNGFTSSLRLSVTADPNEGAFVFKNSAGNGQWTGWVWNSATSGDNLFISFMTEAGGTGRGSIIYNRGAGLLAFNTTSDYRAKDILGPVTDAGATIDAIKVHNGKMKGATVARPMLVAHEAQEVVPYAVMGEKDALNKDGTAKYQQMDHQSLVPLLIAEVQSLRARVAQLEGK